MQFLRELPHEITNIQSDNLYKFWPITREGNSGTSSINAFCKDLLQNVIECLSVEDRVFKGPSSSNDIGKVAKASANSYDASLQESEFHWLSLSNGYLEDERLYDLPKLSEILGSIGFPVISTPYCIIKALKNSKHIDSFDFFTPAIIRDYLRHNRDRWDTIPREEVLQLFEYVLKDKKFDELEGFEMIPLADGTLGTLTQDNNSDNNSYVYISPHNTDNKNDECNVFKNQLKKFVDKSINFGLYNCLYENAKSGWNLNIKILDESAVADRIKSSLNSENVNSDEIPISNHREWIYLLWENLQYRNWDLPKFEDIHLIPTNRSTIRKLKTPKKVFSNKTSKKFSIKSLNPVLETFNVVFVEDEFDSVVFKWKK